MTARVVRFFLRFVSGAAAPLCAEQLREAQRCQVDWARAATLTLCNFAGLGMIQELSSVLEPGEQGASFRMFGSRAAAPLLAAQLCEVRRYGGARKCAGGDDPRSGPGLGRVRLSAWATEHMGDRA
jgi:hypothetical protein